MAGFPGKGLSNTQVSRPSGVVNQCTKTGERGARLDPPLKDGKFGPGKGLSNTQTRNSPSNKP